MLAIIIPAYNEDQAIEQVIKDIRRHFKKESYEIVVVDDASTDKTSELARNMDCTVIRHLLNSGSGAATTTGLAYAFSSLQCDAAATLDGDAQHSAEDLLKAVKHLRNEKMDLVIGSRLIDSNGMSKIKVLGNRGLSLFTQILFGINVTDSQSGMRVFSRNALERIKLKTTGYEFCSEMLWRAKQQNLRISEVPIKAIYTEYSMSKGQNNWNAFMIIKSLIKRRLTEAFYE